MPKIKNILSNHALALMHQDAMLCNLNQAIESEARYPLITKQGYIHESQMVTVLHVFARYGCPDAVSYFLGQGYDRDMVNKVKFNQVEVSDSGRETSVVTWTNYTDISPLMYAITWGQSAIASMFINAGANLNLIDSYKNATALMYAIKKGNTDLAGLIISTPGINVNLTDTSKSNALMYEARYDYAALANQTLYTGTNVSAVNVGGQTARDIALSLGNLDVVGVIDAYVATHP